MTSDDFFLIMGLTVHICHWEILIVIFGPDDGFSMERTGAEGEEDWEEEDDVDQAEVQRRRERLEREQWLREQVGFMVCSFFAHTHEGGGTNGKIYIWRKKSVMVFAKFC